MAQRIQTLFIDDIDGSEAEGTVRFSLDGTTYEIDLNTKHDEELRSALRTYITNARKVTAPRPSLPKGRGGRITGRNRKGYETSMQIRTWARENGHDVNDRGRIPSAIVEEFRDANPGVLV